MALGDLLRAFEGEETLPVDLKKVSTWLIEKGVQDEIEFVGVELDVGIIRGFLHRFRYQRTVYGEPIGAASIYYATNQSEDWVNMVCAKELVHIMDGHCVVRKEEFDVLVKRLTLPRELKILLEDPAYAQFDKFGDAFGAAVLLPMAARSILIGAYNAGEITVDDIARAAVMPTRYVRIVMDPDWEALYGKMCEL